MLLRLNSRRLPTQVLNPDYEFMIAKDKSSILVKGTRTIKTFISPEFNCSRHSILVRTHPTLGLQTTWITPDDGPQRVKITVKGTAEELQALDELDYHFKVGIMPIDFLGE